MKGAEVSIFDWQEIDNEAVKTARLLAADAVEKVGNGHPGTAISLAPVAYTLYQKIMKHDPKDTEWIGRDRFILSIGHSSLTQYVQLFLGGFGLELDDIKALRTWGSKTPGHPEYGHTNGVEITTGPLGQGLASAVGFAYAARYERGLFDAETAEGESPFDHHIYVLAGDGDMQEGVTSEASSLAGHQELGNLIAIYDSNQISIEDDTNIAFTENVAARYESYNWQVITVDWKKNGKYSENIEELVSAIEEAKNNTTQPSLIILKTIIGWPSPGKQNTGKIHGSALGADELKALKIALGANAEESFVVPEKVLEHTRKLAERASDYKNKWQEKFDKWAQKNPEKYALYKRLEKDELPENITDYLPDFTGVESLSTRAASGKVLNSLAEALPELWGGSADLAESNNTTISGGKSFVPSKWSTKEWQANPHGRIIHFGVREHAMGSILNGIVLHGKTRAYGGTFLIFSDYMRPAVRLAALMNVPSIFVWTHDSVALGEDGPTHQPIEQLSSLRAIPNLNMVRPADANETAWAWHNILARRGGPSGIALSRQNMPVFERGLDKASGNTLAHASHTAKGGYILAEAANNKIDVIIIATGSEVQLALKAREELQKENIGTRVVSMPCVEWFDEQSEEYKENVLPASVKARVSVEAGLSLGWQRFIGDKGESVSIEHFGASADYQTLFKEFGITSEAVTKAAKKSLSNNK